MNPLSTCAAAIAGVLYPGMSWIDMTLRMRRNCYTAARACLGSLIEGGVSEELVEAMNDADRGMLPHAGMFTAAINKAMEA